MTGGSFKKQAEEKPEQPPERNSGGCFFRLVKTALRNC
jgi:hypothetical protein